MEEHNTMQALLSAIDKQMFPGGELEEMHQVASLSQLLCFRYDNKDVDTVLRYILSSLFLSDDRNMTKVIKSATDRLNNLFPDADIRLIVRFAIENNERLSLLYGNILKKL